MLSWIRSLGISLAGMAAMRVMLNTGTLSPWVKHVHYVRRPPLESKHKIVHGSMLSTQWWLSGQN